MKITKVRGTRDIIPFDSYTQFFHDIRSHLSIYNFQEIHTPFFEYEETFSKNLGELSDIVSKEMYYVSHKHAAEDDEKIVLRPEFTASVMRAFLENNIDQLPWKVFSSGPAFRHERPQKGRYREFFQTTIEMVGAKSQGYDLELLSILFSFFQKIIPNVFILELNYLGSMSEREIYRKKLYDYCYERMHLFPENFIETLSEKNILRILDHKSENIKEVLKSAPMLFDSLGEESISKWNFIIKGLDELKVPYIHNKKLIRGLDYYNGLIFEFSSHLLGSQNALAGGGRYDQLALQMGSKKEIPALGAGIGIDRVLLVVDQMKKKSEECKEKIGIIVDNAENEEIIFYNALKIQKEFAFLKITTIIYFDKESIKSALKKANQDNVNYVIFVNKKSLKENKFKVKNMNEKDIQQELNFEEIKIKFKNY